MSGMNSGSANKRWLNSVKPKELAAVYRAAIAAGCTCEVTRRTHVKVTAPGGATVHGPLTGGGHSDKMTRTRIRRLGVEI